MKPLLALVFLGLYSVAFAADDTPSMSLNSNGTVTVFSTVAGVKTNFVFQFTAGKWQVRPPKEASPLPPLPTEPPLKPNSWGRRAICIGPTEVLNFTNGHTRVTVIKPSDAPLPKSAQAIGPPSDHTNRLITFATAKKAAGLVTAGPFCFDAFIDHETDPPFNHDYFVTWWTNIPPSTIRAQVSLNPPPVAAWTTVVTQSWDPSPGAVWGLVIFADDKPKKFERLVITPTSL